MKHLVTALLALLIFGCSPSENETKLQNKTQNEITDIEFKKVIETIRLENTKLNSTASNKGDNSKASNEADNRGVYFVPIYSNDVRPGVRWYIPWPIPNTNLDMIVFFPQNGDDRALVFSENEFMANYNIQGPTVYIWDNDINAIKYSNFCDDNKTGIYSMRWKAEYLAIDQDRDGVNDIYLWGQPWQSTNKNGRMHVKTTLTNTHSFSGNCPTPTEEVDFSFVLQTHNGTPRVEAIIDGTKYSL